MTAYERFLAEFRSAPHADVMAQLQYVDVRNQPCR